MTEEELYKNIQLEKEYKSAMDFVKAKTRKVITIVLSDETRKEIENWIQDKQLWLNNIRNRQNVYDNNEVEKKEYQTQIDSLNKRITRARNHLNGFLPEPHIIN